MNRNPEIKNQILNNILETKSPKKKITELTHQVQKLQTKIKKLATKKVDQMDDGWRGYIKTTLASDRKTVFSYIKCCRILEALKSVGEINDNYCSFDHWKMNANGYFKDKPEIEEKVKQRLADNLSRVENALDYTTRRKTIFCTHCIDNLAKEGIICQWGSNWMWTTQRQTEKEKDKRDEWLKKLTEKTETSQENKTREDFQREFLEFSAQQKKCSDCAKGNAEMKRLAEQTGILLDNFCDKCVWANEKTKEEDDREKG